MVDIRIPEEETKSFTFTKRQAIYTEPIKVEQTKMTVFPKGVYNIYKLRYEIKTSPLVEYIDLNIETTNNNIYITTKFNTIRFSPELAEILNIPKTLPPFSHIKISGDEKYLINCNLIEANSSYFMCCVCEVGTVGKISDCQPEGPGFNPRPGRGLNFGRLSFAIPSVDRDVKPLV